MNYQLLETLFINFIYPCSVGGVPVNTRLVKPSAGHSDWRLGKFGRVFVESAGKVSRSARVSGAESPRGEEGTGWSRRGAEQAGGPRETDEAGGPETGSRGRNQAEVTAGTDKQVLHYRHNY